MIEHLQGLRGQVQTLSGQTALESAICDAKRVVYRVLDFEQIFNIHEGTSSVEYQPYPAESLLSTLSNLVGSEMSKKEIMMETLMESSFPESVNTHLELLKQVFINVVSSLTSGASGTSLILTASGYQTSSGVEAVLDLTCEAHGLSPEEIK